MQLSFRLQTVPRPSGKSGEGKVYKYFLFHFLLHLTAFFFFFFFLIGKHLTILTTGQDPECTTNPLYFFSDQQNQARKAPNPEESRLRCCTALCTRNGNSLAKIGAGFEIFIPSAIHLAL